jgi:hypothetical protein
MLVTETFPKAKSILGVTAIDGTADTIAVKGQCIQFINVSGNIWINPLGVAVANTTSLKTVAGDVIELLVTGNLSIISDGSGGTYQYIIYDL